jgi:hypothetical protein
MEYCLPMDRVLTVKQLKAFIEHVPGDSIVVVRGPEHEFRLAKVTPARAIFYKDGQIDEDYEDSELRKEDGGKYKFVLVVE